MRISDWSSDVCSSDLHQQGAPIGRADLVTQRIEFTPAVAETFAAPQLLQYVLRNLRQRLRQRWRMRAHAFPRPRRANPRAQPFLQSRLGGLPTIPFRHELPAVATHSTPGFLPTHPQRPQLTINN